MRSPLQFVPMLAMSVILGAALFLGGVSTLQATPRSALVPASDAPVKSAGSTVSGTGTNSKVPTSTAPAGRITGTIIDRGTGEALVGANVIIRGTSIGAASDLDGRYTIPSAPSGEQVLVVSYIGYQRQEQVVQVRDGQSIVVDFQLDWAGIEGQEVVITAQASGQMAAINQQLASNTITNIVSADRIQELPDVNAAESIGRLPGVSIQRSGGEANKIAIRGLSPKYNVISVNGVRVPSTGGDDRSVDLSLISSNMLDGIEVMKAITPDKDADAIGGSVDLRLRQAPENLIVDLQAQGGYNRLQDYYGNYRFAGTLSNRFLDNRLGIIATGSLDGHDRSADKFNGVYGLRTNSVTQEQEIVITQLNLREESMDRGRMGASLLADYRIPGGRITGNAFYNRLTSEGQHRVYQAFNSGNSRAFYNMNLVENTTSILTSALGLEQNFGWITYDAGVSLTASRSDSPRDYYYTFAQEGNAYAPFERTPGMDPRQVLQYLTPDSAFTGLSDIYFQDVSRHEDQSAVQANVQMPFRVGNSVDGYVKVGGKLRWLDRENDEGQSGRGGMHYGLGSGSAITNWFRCMEEQRFPDGLNGFPIAETAVNYGLLPIFVFNDRYDRPNFLDGDYPLGYTVDPEIARSFAEELNTCGEFLEQVVASRGRDYTGEERYQAGYLMSEFNVGRILTFIPGVRWERDWSRYQGQQFREVVINNQASAPTDLDTLIAVRENTFLLPMVHLRVRPTNWLQLHLARTETISRPDYIQYVPITRINNMQDFAFAGNANLRPSHTTNYDAMLSVYGNTVGLFTFAVFHKTMKDHIRWVRMYTISQTPPADLNVPEEWLRQNPVVDTYINNPFDATYRGFEIDWQTNFWYLPSVLKGLVFNANYTRIFSDTQYQSFERERVCVNCPSPRPRYDFEVRELVRDGRMIDQPAHIANLTLGYDYKGFSGRLSYLIQTDRTSSVHTVVPVLDTFSGTYQRYDLSLRQKLRYGLELYTNFNNLTNTTDRSFQGSPTGSPTYIEYYGFTMDVGMRFRY